MFEFDKLCKEYEKLTYDERRTMLSELSADILPALKLMSHGEEDFEILMVAACSSDGKLGVEEYSLLKDVTGIDFSFERIQKKVEDANSKDIQQAADLIVDSFGEISEELKSLMVSFCVCLCSSDNRITAKEKSFLKKLLK